MASRPRLTWCSLAFLAPLVPISARLARLQVLDHRKLSRMAMDESSLESRETAPRGRILDRSGRVLAESIPAWSVFADPASVRGRAASARALAAVLGEGAGSILGKMRAGGRFVWLKRRVPLETYEKIKALKLAGVGAIREDERFYPNGEAAQSVLGKVGAEGKGMSGLEWECDQELTGRSQKFSLIRDGTGRHALLKAPESPGMSPDVRLTIDLNIQHFAETALKEGVEKHRPSSALVLVQDPRSGNILAAAAYPEDPLKNPAIQDAYEPGSTYKLVTMAAVLEERAARLEDTVDGEQGRWEVAPGVFIKDHEPLGSMTVSRAMEESSNIAMAKLGLRLGPEAMYRWSQAFGFGMRTGILLPGESAGHLRLLGRRERVALANNAFGQGLSATPLQILSAYTAIANGGTLLEPRLIEAIGRSPARPAAVVRRVAPPETVRLLASLLEGVVEQGTGTSAAVPGYSVAGKTGTAQKIDPSTGRYSTTAYVGSFVGFAPLKDPRFTILVVMDSPKKGYYGADVAAPIFSKLMSRLLALEGIVPDKPFLATAPR